MIYEAYAKSFEVCGEKIVPVEFYLASDIPMSRGLGSSAACVVMGIMAAFDVMKKDFDKKEILKIATEMEGHPDNVSPAIFGGGTAAIYDKGQVFVEKFNVSDKIKFLALIPYFKLSTKLARQALPKTYTRDDAVFNISRLSLLILSLISGDEENIKVALEDKIHQPYRFKLIPEINQIEKILDKSPALGHYLSGAGSTIMILLDSSDIKSQDFIKNKVKKLKGDYKVLPLEIDKTGAFII